MPGRGRASRALAGASRAGLVRWSSDVGRPGPQSPPYALPFHTSAALAIPSLVPSGRSCGERASLLAVGRLMWVPLR